MGKPLREYNTLKTFEKLAGHMGLNELAPQGTLHPVGRRDLIKDLLAHANNSFWEVEKGSLTLNRYSLAQAGFSALLARSLRTQQKPGSSTD